MAVWKVIADNYVDLSHRGLDWVATRVEFERRVGVAQTAGEYHGLIAEMVGRLADDHSRYLSPSRAREEDAVRRGQPAYGGIGIVATWAEVPVVQFVYAGSPAERAGVRRRDRILQLDGRPVANERDFLRGRGIPGTTVRVALRAPMESPREVVLLRDIITPGVTLIASRLARDPGIGYLVIPTFALDEVDRVVERTLRALVDDQPLEGLVLDLRGNGGGQGRVAQAILGHFAMGQVGEFRGRHSPYITVTTSALKARLDRVPLAVLVDGSTQSYGEVVAAVLQATGRAKLVGRPTKGNTKFTRQYDFPDGSRLLLAEWIFALPDGRTLEGIGAYPDVALEVDWTRFREEDDPYLLAAIELIRDAGQRPR